MCSCYAASYHARNNERARTLDYMENPHSNEQKCQECKKLYKVIWELKKELAAPRALTDAHDREVLNKYLMDDTESELRAMDVGLDRNYRPIKAAVIKNCETCDHWKVFISNTECGKCEITGPEWRSSHENVPIRTSDHEGDSPVITLKTFGCNQWKPLNIK